MDKLKEIDNYAAYVYRFISQYVKITQKEFNLFLPYFEVRSFPKKMQLVKYGEIDNYLNLVVKGLLRKFVFTDKEERTLQLATEGHIIQSEISFHKRVPSNIIIETIEPSVIVSINYDNVQHVLQHVPSAEEAGRQMMIYMFIKKDTRYFMQLNSSAKDRFLNFANEHPHLLQRVPQRILASYLEMKPETFSRLKHLLPKI